ncbi:MAG: family 10 glycosylhydrolase [Candidatus Sumerlaeaceae bacterium]|nr:family 10 glycosylhydrolase [Candidatus Sumerlaeaceae bacterium]
MIFARRTFWSFAALLALSVGSLATPPPLGDADVESQTQATASKQQTSRPTSPQVSEDVAQMNTMDQGAAQSQQAKPTAIGNKGGATPQTENLPLDKASLAELRKKQLGQPEFRGAWVTRFDWTSPDPNQARSKILHIMDTAKAAGLNAVVFQVRADCSTLYPSSLEPWSHMLGGKDPGFDPVAFAIEEAHKRGLEFHAYINACPASERRDGPLPGSKSIWFVHCTQQSNPNWLVYEGGKPAEFKEYWWLNPNLPEVQTYLRTVVLDFASRYNIDGIHFDRIRFPGPKVSDDPWSKARYAGDGNPLQLGYDRWQRDNITRMLTDIYGAVTAIKPHIKFSAAVWGIYDKTKLPQGNDKRSGYSWTSSGLQDYHQDSIEWTRRGCMDALIPMVYWAMGGDKPDYDELVANFVKLAGNNRHIYGGQKVFDDVEMLRQAVATRLVGGLGTCPFTLNAIEKKGLVPFYRSTIFPDDVPTPPMPWKTSPTNATILVWVKDTAGRPVLDAHVQIEGRSDVWLSSADGFCAIIDAVPGRNVIKASKPSLRATAQPLAVEAIAGKPATAVLVVTTPAQP